MSDPDSGDTAASQVRLWSIDGLDAQPRMAALRRHVPPELGYAPDTTPWRSSSLDLPEAFGAGDSARFGSPGELVAALLPVLEAQGRLGRDVWERTSRIWLEGEDEDEAVAVVLQWGLKDDAVTGHDFRFRLRADREGWHVEQIEERFHCGRSVTEDGICA